MGGLFVKRDLVEQLLTSKSSDDRPGVLDVGTGTGKWAIDIARQFPESDVLGIDLTEPTADQCASDSLDVTSRTDCESSILGRLLIVALKNTT